jgi:hypothetical protein
VKIRLLWAIAAFFLASIAPGALAQSNPPASAPPPAQAASQSASQESPTVAPGTAKQENRVWTNDNIGSALARQDISVLESKAANSAPMGKPAHKTALQNAKSYYSQVAKLRAQIASLDKNIAQLQAVIDGAPTGDGKTSTRPRGVKATNWNAELTQLKQQREGLMTRLVALENQGQHHGIPHNPKS